jgi:hypothetical protein
MENASSNAPPSLCDVGERRDFLSFLYFTKKSGAFFNRSASNDILIIPFLSFSTLPIVAELAKPLHCRILEMAYIRGYETRMKNIFGDGFLLREKRGSTQ